MRGNDLVIQQLNAALKEELTAIVQYMVHAEMCQNWGYKHLGDYIKKQAIDEMRHAEGLIERILFLEGAPKVDVMMGPRIGQSVKEQIEIDLEGEVRAVGQYNAAVKICANAGDDATRALFEKMTRDEEEHTDFLETQLSIIKDIGMEKYLSMKMHPKS
jgi:bacterioferritin